MKEQLSVKSELEELELLRITFETNEWDDFLLVYNEIRQRDKDLISMYRDRIFKLTNGCNNAINELTLLNGSKDIAILELQKAIKK